MTEPKEQKTDFTVIALRQSAVFVPEHAPNLELQPSTLTLAIEMAGLGFGMDESLLGAINGTSPNFQRELLSILRSVMGMEKNWAPLVKDWKVPTNETLADYFMTYVATLQKTEGAKMPCGHIIPDGSFPLERYNGCPFCKTPFEFGEIEHTGQGSKLKVLTLWKLADLESFFCELLQSKTPLDATQADSLKCLLGELALPNPLNIAMKETMALVIDSLVAHGKDELAGSFLKTPTDVLRYLWYKNTGFAQLIQPKTIVRKGVRNRRASATAYAQYLQNKTFLKRWNKKQRAQVEALENEHREKLIEETEALTKSIKLKYSRPECRRVAKWMNALPMDVQSMAESMHPNRGIWVRAIRALRLVEFGKKTGYEKLKQLLDAFHSNSYEVWLGKVGALRLERDLDGTLALLKKRPGAFARALFSNMLWFGDEAVLKSFAQVADKVPARLLLTLAMYAELYFDPTVKRNVRPRGGNSKSIPANPLLNKYSEAERNQMVEQVQSLAFAQMKTRFAKFKGYSQTMYIDPMLEKMPLPIGDRAESIQSLPVALMGTRFPVEGDSVRLFMCWGMGLPAQHLDMDLSCMIAYDDKQDRCSYSQLTTAGCQHSGDIIHIPKDIGTAEYIELDLAKLKKEKARYVAFTCNAYSSGELALKMIVGWMSSKHPMKVSKKTGVAYDPSCVQHQVEISQTLSKGMVFGVLDVAASEIIWLEMPFGGQVVGNLNLGTINSLLKRLDSKMTIGQLLKIMAEAQGIEVFSDLQKRAAFDEIYDISWARNAAAVTQLMVD